jgi:hypothetical protein
MRRVRAFRNPQGAPAYRRGVLPLDPLGVAFGLAALIAYELLKRRRGGH